MTTPGGASGSPGLARRAVRGAVWTIVTGVVARFIGVVSSLVLTHYLTTAVMGETSVATILTMTAGTLSLFGTTQYCIAKRDLDRAAMFQVTVVHVGLGVVALVATLALAGPLAPVFQSPGMVKYVPGLALSVLLNRISLIPERIMVRDLRFAPVSIARTIGEITYAGSSVALAYLGWGGMAIVWAAIVRSVIRTLILVLLIDRREWLQPAPIDRARIRDIFRFGTALWLANNANFAARNWDNLLFAALFGSAEMGLYKQAYNLADVPSTAIGEQIGDVLLPSFARLDDEAKKHALVRGTGLLAILVFPLAVGLGVVSQTLVPALFNAEWQGVAPYLTVLSALSVVRPIGWIVGSYLQARLMTRAQLMLDLLKIGALLGSIAALSPLGPLWASAGVGIGFALNGLGSIWVVGRYDRVPTGRIWRAMAGPAAACVIMTAAVLGVRFVVGLEAHPKLGLAVEVAVGGVSYLGACFLVAGAVTRDLLGLLRKSFGRA